MFSRKLAASAAVLTLGATSLVACSDDDGDSTTSTEVVSETATETNTSTETAGNTSTSSASSAASSSATASSANAEATEEIKTAAGTAMVPAGVKAAMDKYADPAWGEPMAVEEVEDGWIVTYDQEHYITWNPNTGGAPTWGQIANEWMTDVRLDKKLGFPLAPETENPDKSGWTQEFERGTIEWTRGGTNDAFTAIVTEK